MNERKGDRKKGKERNQNNNDNNKTTKQTSRRRRQNQKGSKTSTRKDMGSKKAIIPVRAVSLLRAKLNQGKLNLIQQINNGMKWNETENQGATGD